jgi:hypothetical protein
VRVVVLDRNGESPPGRISWSDAHSCPACDPTSACFVSVGENYCATNGLVSPFDHSNDINDWRSSASPPSIVSSEPVM